MDTLSASIESIILSALPAESMILSELFGPVITISVAITRKTIIGNSDNCHLRSLVNSASTAAPIGLPKMVVVVVLAIAAATAMATATAKHREEYILA